MTDRISHLTVSLERDIREDDIEPLITAIRMLRGVMNVEEHVSDHNTWIATDRVRMEVWGKIRDVFFPEMAKKGDRVE